MLLHHRLTNPEDSHENFTSACEFSQPCHMPFGQYRGYFLEIVSHLFGRNKSGAKVLPRPGLSLVRPRGLPVIHFEDLRIYHFSMHIDHHGYERVCLSSQLSATSPTCYRAERWPFIQVDLHLLLESLDRMETWGQVESFEMRLRRREVLRANGPRPGLLFSASYCYSRLTV